VPALLCGALLRGAGRDEVVKIQVEAEKLLYFRDTWLWSRGEIFELCLLLICINKKALQAMFTTLCLLFANPSLVRKKAVIF